MKQLNLSTLEDFSGFEHYQKHLEGAEFNVINLIFE